MTWNRMTARTFRWRFVSLLALLMGLAAPSAARADFLTSLSGKAVPSSSGDFFTYTYVVTNLSGSTDVFGALNVNVAPSANVSDIMGPTGWLGFFDQTDSLVQWVSPGLTSGLLPGSSGTFSFVSPLAPVSQDYLAFGFSSGGIDTNTGTTVGPGVAVPEPGSFVLLSVGCLLLLLRARLPGRADSGRAGLDHGPLSCPYSGRKGAF